MNNIVCFTRPTAVTTEQAAALHVVAQIIFMNDLTPGMVADAAYRFYASLNDDSDGDCGLLSDD